MENSYFSRRYDSSKGWTWSLPGFLLCGQHSSVGSRDLLIDGLVVTLLFSISCKLTQSIDLFAFWAFTKFNPRWLTVSQISWAIKCAGFRHVFCNALGKDLYFKLSRSVKCAGNRQNLLTVNKSAPAWTSLLLTRIFSMKTTTVKCMVRVRPLSAKETHDGADKCVLAVGQQVNNVILAKSVKRAVLLRVFHAYQVIFCCKSNF